MGCQKFDKNFCNFLEVIHSEKSNYSEKIGANYYPFGLKHKGYNNVTPANVNAVASKFKYNGIELEESLGLNLYEMEWRQYDATLGRFNGIDLMSEKMYSQTPYHFSLNNPVYYSDPTGLYPDCRGCDGHHQRQEEIDRRQEDQQYGYERGFGRPGDLDFDMNYERELSITKNSNVSDNAIQSENERQDDKREEEIKKFDNGVELEEVIIISNSLKSHSIAQAQIMMDIYDSELYDAFQGSKEFNNHSGNSLDAFSVFTMIKSGQKYLIKNLTDARHMTSFSKNFFKYTGRTLNGISLIYSLNNTLYGGATWNSFYYDLAMAGISTIPYVGVPLSILGSIYKEEIMNSMMEYEPLDFNNLSPSQKGHYSKYGGRY